MIIELNTDRALVLGRVVAMHVRDDCVLDAARCYIDTPKPVPYTPLTLPTNRKGESSVGAV